MTIKSMDPKDIPAKARKTAQPKITPEEITEIVTSSERVRPPGGPTCRKPTGSLWVYTHDSRLGAV